MNDKGDEMKLIERVNQAASARLESFLYDLLPDGKIEGQYFVAKNPTRGDSEPGSFKINLQTCKWKDFATSDRGGNDPVSLYRYLTGKSKMGEAARELAQKLGVSGKATTPKTIQSDEENSSSDQSAKTKRSNKWQPIQPVPESTEPPPAGMVSNQCWVYKDKSGQLIGYIMRRDKGDGKKDFFPLTYCVNIDTGETAWRFQGFQAPRPIYGLDLLNNFPDRGVVIVEGEKTAEAARKILNGDAVVITWPGGSNSINEVDWSELAGRRVAIWPDNDKPGHEAAEKIALKIVDTAEVVKIVSLPDDLPQGWDLADADESWNRERLRDFIRENAKIFERETRVDAPSADLAGEVFERICKETPGGSEFLQQMADNILGGKIGVALRRHFLLDEWTGSWFYFSDIWRETNEQRVRAEVESILTRILPTGFSMSKFGSIFGFAKLKLPRASLFSGLHSGVVVDSWNAEKSLIPFRNGVLNVNTRELIPHAPELMFNWRLPYDYDPLAQCPTILEVIGNISGGDRLTARVLLSFLAAVVYGRSDLQKYLELIGKPGAGKSTFIKIAQSLVGDENAISTGIRQLTENRFETSRLYGKRLVMITDADQWAGSVEVFKAITGQDPIRFEKKHVNQGRDFVFGGLVIVAANSPIQTTDHSTAMARRRIPVYVEKAHPKEKVDPRLDDKLKSQMAGLFNVLLDFTQDELERTLMDVNGERRLVEARSVNDTNSISEWADQNLIYDPGVHVKIGDRRYEGGKLANVNDWLYPNYIDFLDRNGLKGQIGLKSFSTKLLELLERQGIAAEKKRSEKGIVLKNVRLRIEIAIGQGFSPDRLTPTLFTKEKLDTADD